MFPHAVLHACVLFISHCVLVMSLYLLSKTKVSSSRVAFILADSWDHQQQDLKLKEVFVWRALHHLGRELHPKVYVAINTHWQFLRTTLLHVLLFVYFSSLLNNKPSYFRKRWNCDWLKLVTRNSISDISAKQGFSVRLTNLGKTYFLTFVLLET